MRLGLRIGLGVGMRLGLRFKLGDWVEDEAEVWVRGSS